MNKKQYIAPSTAAFDTQSLTFICGSGTASETINGGETGNEPNPDDSGIIHGDSKSGISWADDDVE